MSPAEQAHFYARQGNATALSKVCQADPSLINVRSIRDGSTPLHAAALYGNARTAHHMLTKLGANPQLKDQTGQRPIDIAAKSGHELSSQLLAEATYPRIQLELIRLERETRDDPAEQRLLTEPQLRRLEGV
ncbi:MAG: ankyrin repeat domain-containing protein [Parvularculaceae bacterium]|nr:ankyrin repeat domain-containing protein [Parvularculaceae bacterium]